MPSLKKPSPALVVAFVALVAALSGSAIALPGKNKIDRNDVKKNAISSKQLKNNGVKGADVDEGSLGKVPAAGTADSADTASNSNALGGRGAAAFQPSAVEARQEPDYGEGWGAYPHQAEAPSFYKDRGRVFLQGAAARSSGTGAVIFTLPAGYRPAASVYFVTYAAGGTTASVNVEPDGEVQLFDGDPSYVGLTNVSFRAAG